MATFTDCKGNTRELTLTVRNVERVRRLVKDADGNPIDLTKVGDKLGEDDVLVRVTSDPILLCQVLHALLDCNFDEFADCMDGDTIENATEALIGALIDFFPRSRRELLKRAAEKGRTLDQQTTKEGMKMIESEEFETLVRAMRSRQFEKRFGRSPDGSASTPDRSRSGNS